MPIFQALDYLGTVAFAISGALVAIHKKMDILGMVVLALATAIGGGTVRDLLLHRDVFWLQDSVYVLLSVAAALYVFLRHHAIVPAARALRIWDALGLGVFTAIGAMKAQEAGCSLTGIVVMACLTGVGGGMIRDLLAREIPFVLCEQVYASACILGAFAFWGMTQAGANQTATICVTAGLTTAVRLLSIARNWELPKAE